jgi:O-methyltransferase
MLLQLIKRQLNRAGFDIVRLNKAAKWPADFEPFHREVVTLTAPFTMTSRERIFGLMEAVKYITANGIEGDVVECGVWKGGSMLAAAKTLVSLHSTDRTLYLYDTFEGMSAPTEDDVSHDDLPADALLKSDTNKEKNLIWAYSTLDTVKQTMAMSGYPEGKVHYVKGKVEETIPATLPERIALLRLDTDWYESTRHELIHLFPRLVPGGVLIIDDYGYWKGARKAVDEYLSENKITILLNRLDDTGRIAIKR